MESPKKRNKRARRAQPTEGVEPLENDERDERAVDEDAPADVPVPVARLTSSSGFQATIILVAFVYLSTVWLDGIGSNLPAKLTPRVWLFFVQIAALFKNAGVMAIDYRAEGWVCSEKKWVEVDVRPWFRIDADNKESRFHRAMQFYRKERKVMRSLEDFVIKSNNAGGNRPTIGGVRFSSLRIPYPKVGERVEAIAWKKLDDYPEEMKHAWYWTPSSMRRERCGDHSPKSPKSEGSRTSTAPSASASSSEGSDEASEAPSSSAPDKDPEP